MVELDWPHSIARLSKLPIRRKNLRDISYRIGIIAILSQISLPWQQGSVGVKFCWRVFDGSTPKPPPYGRKDLKNISNRSQVIAHFVSNFIAMATRESPGVNLNDTVRLAISSKTIP